MAYLLTNNLVFIHCPKTGGSSLLNAFKRCGILKRQIGHEHATFAQSIDFCTLWPRTRMPHLVKEFIQNVTLNRDHLVTFGVVRHPYFYYPSLYSYLCKRNRDGVGSWRRVLGQERWHPWQIFDSFSPKDFESFQSFLEKLLYRAPGYLTHLYSDYFPENFIRHTAKLESLQSDLQQVPGLDQTTFDFEIPRENVNRHDVKWSRDQLQEMYLADRYVIDRFNYELIE